jgi:cytochrome c-type biogenesis protein CcmE
MPARPYPDHRKPQRGLYLIALALLFGGIVYLAVSGLAANSLYHLQVAEALQLKPEKPVSVAIAGEVSAEGLRFLNGSGEGAGGPGVRFKLRDNLSPEKNLWAVYQGDIPELFAPDAPVILEGVYAGDGRDLRVVKLNTLCPTKYEKKSDEAKAARPSA